MTSAYYIAYHESYGGTWYRLIARDSHFCIACGSDLDKITKCLWKNAKRYKTRERLNRAISELDCGGKVSPATFEQSEEWYRLHGKDYADLVHSTVVGALREAREEEKANSPLRKTTNRLKKVGVIKAVAETTEEHKQKDSTHPQDSSPKILRKPRVFNRK